MPTENDLSLYSIESDLMTLLDTEELVPAEQREEFRAQLAEQFKGAIDKRQACAEFLNWCGIQKMLCEAEIERLKCRAERFSKANGRLRGYIRDVMEALGKKKLEAHTFTFSLRAKPGRVEISDESIVPDEFRTATFTLPMEVYNGLLEALAEAEEVSVSQWLKQSVKTAISKSGIKDAIDSGREIPGADLVGGVNTLVIN